MANVGMQPPNPMDFMQGLYGGVQNWMGGMPQGMGMNRNLGTPTAPQAPAAGYGGPAQPGAAPPAAVAPGGYGGAGAAATPGAGATGYAGTPATQTPGSTGVNLNPASDFTNPTTAIYAVLKQLGVNTASSDPRIAGLLQHAQDLVNQNVIPAIAGGQVGPMDTAGIGGIIKDVVQRAITNQPVFYGAGAGANVLQQLMGAAAGGQNTQAPEGLRFLASIMDNPQAAAALGSSLMYGGAIPSAVSNVLGKPLAQAPTDWQILNATMPGGMPLPGQQGYMNLLQRYLGGQFGNLGQPAAAGQ